MIVIMAVARAIKDKPHKTAAKKHREKHTGGERKPTHWTDLGLSGALPRHDAKDRGRQPHGDQNGKKKESLHNPCLQQAEGACKTLENTLPIPLIGA